MAALRLPPGTTGPLSHGDPLSDARRAGRRAAPRVEARIPLDGAADHGVSEALYLRDPDENGVELYWDRPEELWPRMADGQLAMFTRPLDLDGLLRETTRARPSEPWAPDRATCSPVDRLPRRERA